MSRKPVLWAIGILVLVSITSVDGVDYVIYGKKSFRAHSDYPISILCFNRSEDINVNVSLEADNVVISSKSAVLRPDEVQLIYLQVRCAGWVE